MLVFVSNKYSPNVGILIARKLNNNFDSGKNFSKGGEESCVIQISAVLPFNLNWLKSYRNAQCFNSF